MFLSDFNGLFELPQGFDRVRRLQRQLNQAFDGYAGVPRGQYPLVNIFADNDTASVTMELPGVDPGSLDISVLDKALTIKGERAAEPLAEGEKYISRERVQGAFSRTVELPFPADAEKVEASFKHGVLTIRLPRAERDKPKKIAIS